MSVRQAIKALIEEHAFMTRRRLIFTPTGGDILSAYKTEIEDLSVHIEVRDHLNPSNPLGLFEGDFRETVKQKDRQLAVIGVPAPTKDKLVNYITSCLAYAGYFRDQFPNQHFAIHSVESKDGVITVSVNDLTMEITVVKKQNKRKQNPVPESQGE